MRVFEQYRKAKEDNPGVILLFRMGDFYEVFGDDVKTVATLLGLSVTERKAKGKSVPMAGFPYHSVTSNVEKLVKSGFRVALQDYTSPKR